jgi:hypothetical protein
LAAHRLLERLGAGDDDGKLIVRKPDRHGEPPARIRSVAEPRPLRKSVSGFGGKAEILCSP